MKAGSWFHQAIIHMSTPVMPNSKIKVCLCFSITQHYHTARKIPGWNAKGKPIAMNLTKYRILYTSHKLDLLISKFTLSQLLFAQKSQTNLYLLLTTMYKVSIHHCISFYFCIMTWKITLYKL